MNVLLSGETLAGRDFDMLAEVAKTQLSCDMIFVSIAKHEKLFSVGLDLSSAKSSSNRVHRAADTVCQTTVDENRIVALENAKADERFNSLEYVTKGDIVGYLGVPLRAQSDQAYGAVCAITNSKRSWSPNERQFLESLSMVVSSLIAKETQQREMVLLQESMKEADLVLMTLSQEISALVSVHNPSGSVLFASLRLMRMAPEISIEDAAVKLFDMAASENLGQGIEPNTEIGSYLILRSGNAKYFKSRVVKSQSGTFFIVWTPKDTQNFH